MHVDWWTLALQAVNFLVLAWLLQHFLYQPVMRVVAARRAESDRLLADAEAGRRRAEELEADAARQRGQMAQERDALLGEARSAAAKEAQALVEQARGQAGQVMAEARLRVKHDAEEAARALRRQAARLAGAMASRLAQSAPPPALAFLPRLAEALDSLPEATRAGLREGPLVVASATPLVDGEKAAVRREIAARLGEGAAPAFVTDAALIAGLEVRSPHVVLRGNWATDLDALANEAAGDDGAV